MAKLGIVISRWMQENDLVATAIQCWNSIQKNYGVNACTLMAMMSDQLLPSACEVDITGVISMYALQLASDTPRRWWTGTTTMLAIPTSACCSIAGTGLKPPARCRDLKQHRS